ncbi:NfeD family protein [Trueperella sp. LYQ143]|uniref:NfeD family protein n=1 Tax=unclassified Trueperella TaxID=2630174 RepID=UPI003982F0A6
MAWQIWAIITIVLLIIETLSVDFLFAMLASGTAAALCVSLLWPDGLAIQVIVFAVVAALGIGFVRPWAKRHVNDSSHGESNVYAMVGQSGVAVTDITEDAGQVRISGEVWSARSAEGSIASGQEVMVESISGVHAVVRPKEIISRL